MPEIRRAFQPHRQVNITWAVEDAPGGQALQPGLAREGRARRDGARSFRARQPHPDAARRTVAGCRGEARSSRGKGCPGRSPRRSPAWRSRACSVRSERSGREARRREPQGKQAQPARRGTPNTGFSAMPPPARLPIPAQKAETASRIARKLAAAQPRCACEGSSTRPMISPLGLHSVVMKSLSAPFCSGPIASPGAAATA